MTDAEPSPVWVPDSEAPKCMHCLKSEFTVINRRVTGTLLTVAFCINILSTDFLVSSFDVRYVSLILIASKIQSCKLFSDK